MNERVVTSFLSRHITNERVNALAQMTNAALPGAGMVVGILGGLVMRAVAAARQYIKKVDEMPIVPPDILPHMTYKRAVRFFKEKKLTNMFKELLEPAADASNPSVYRDRIRAARAASVVKKCFDKDDVLFNVFYHDQIVHGEYLTIWETYREFLEFKASLRDLLPPAKFKTMFQEVLKAVAKEGAKNIKESKTYARIKELVNEHVNKIVPGNVVDIDKIVDRLGKIP